MTPQAPTFEALLTAARGGNGHALGRLLEFERPQLERYAVTACGSRPRLRGQEADLVQDTLKDAVVGFDRFIGVSEAGWHQWLRRVLENNITDRCRYESAAKRDCAKEQRLDTSYARDLSDGGETPSKLVAQDEELERLRVALNQLSEDDRAVIRLRDTDRLSFEEVARRMGKPSDEAARKLYERARVRLKAAFDALNQN